MFQALLAPSCAEYYRSYELKWTRQEVWTRLKYVQLQLLSLTWHLLFSHTHDSTVKCSVRCLYVYVIFALICSQQMLLILPRLPRQLLKRRKCSSHLSHCDSQLPHEWVCGLGEFRPIILTLANISSVKGKCIIQYKNNNHYAVDSRQSNCCFLNDVWYN